MMPVKAAELLAENTSNRPLSRSSVRAFAEAMRRGDWLVTHQGIAFDTNGVLVDGQHRLAAVIEADLGDHAGRASLTADLVADQRVLPPVRLWLRDVRATDEGLSGGGLIARL